jgi:hypothetical protein
MDDTPEDREAFQKVINQVVVCRRSGCEGAKKFKILPTLAQTGQECGMRVEVTGRLLNFFGLLWQLDKVANLYRASTCDVRPKTRPTQVTPGHFDPGTRYGD